MDSQRPVHECRGVMPSSHRLVAVALLSFGGCRADPGPDPRQRLAASEAPEAEVEARFFERGGPGRLRYRGPTVSPSPLRAGAPLELAHVWEVEVAFASDPRVFVHFESDAQGRLAVDDHHPVGGAHRFSRMAPGEIWRDAHAMRVPSNATSGTLRVFVGLFEGDTRMTLETVPGRNDGQNRLLAAEIPLEGRPAPELPVATVARAQGPIDPDGRLDEPDWASAEILELTDTLGRPRPTEFPTRLRLLYDDRFLYVGFEAEDEDVSERFEKRDDPIYEHETVELFLMPSVTAPELGPYVELQASPGGVLFDASFTGPRQGMDRSFDAGQTVGTRIDGSLNDPAPDRGWVSEWKVPFSGLVDEAPQSGDEWRMNAFRIEKHRRGDRLRGEYTAWSPPLVGDFHAVKRFGRLRFGGER